MKSKIEKNKYLEPLISFISFVLFWLIVRRALHLRCVSYVWTENKGGGIPVEFVWVYLTFVTSTIINTHKLWLWSNISVIEKKDIIIIMVTHWFIYYLHMWTITLVLGLMSLYKFIFILILLWVLMNCLGNLYKEDPLKKENTENWVTYTVLCRIVLFFC